MRKWCGLSCALAFVYLSSFPEINENSVLRLELVNTVYASDSDDDWVSVEDEVSNQESEHVVEEASNEDGQLHGELKIEDGFFGEDEERVYDISLRQDANHLFSSLSDHEERVSALEESEEGSKKFPSSSETTVMRDDFDDLSKEERLIISWENALEKKSGDEAFSPIWADVMRLCSDPYRDLLIRYPRFAKFCLMQPDHRLSEESKEIIEQATAFESFCERISALD